MKELKFSSYEGRQIYARAVKNEGNTLFHIYNKFSANKLKAYHRCYREFLETENHGDFAICSHNTFGFACSWAGTKDGENIIRYETKDNSYLVWLDR